MTDETVDATPEATSTQRSAQKGSSDSQRRHRRRTHGLRNWLILIVVALVAAFVVRTYVFESFYVPSGSMIPTIEPGDHMIVDKLSYHLHAIGFGNIVVFHKPASDLEGPNEHYLVKRVIGLPGQTIWIHAGRVYINGKAIAEPFLPRGVLTEAVGSHDGPFRIPKHEYFVMGDNRGDSYDSRYFGPISSSLIVGRVILIYWPLAHWRYF